MRLPARAVAGNRLWTHDGAVWAVWRVELPSYPFLSDDAKLALHGRVRAALTTLPRHAQLIGVHRRVGARELGEALSGGVRPDRLPRWRDAAGPDARALLARGPVERRVYLAARIVDPHGRTLVESAMALVGDVLGVEGPGPSRIDDRTSRRRAEELGARLARTVGVRPAQAAELRWLHQRAFLRGVADPAPPAAGHPTTDPVPRPLAGSLGDAVLHEGGTAHDPGRGRHRRYLRIDNEQGTSFQTTLVVSEMPPAFAYPGGGEWFAVADLAPFPVDWVARLEAVPNAAAQTRARRQQRQLTAQVAEYDGEPTGPPDTLADALHGIRDEQSALAASPGDPELEVTIGFTVWGDDVAQVDARASQLGDLLEPWGYAVHRPTGGQLPLFAAGLPGVPAPAVCRDYVQFMLPRDLAAGAPFAGAGVGDPQGIPLGVSIAGALPEAVLLDPAHGPATNRSGSLGVFGALGSGKSYFVKRMVLGTVARGGRVVTLDRTTSGEYVRLADAVDGTAAVVELDPSAPVGMDPLRVFSGEDRVRVALGFLSILTRTTPTDVDGAVLAAAVREVAARDGRLVDVLDQLGDSAEPEARVLRRKLQAYRDHPLSQLVLADRPPLTLDADLICFHAPGLALPDRDAMRLEHLAKQLLPEQVFGQALLYLVAAVSRTLVFADDRFGAVLVDEAWALTASPQGRQLLLDTIRDGRKHNAAVWVLSQHPNDLGEDALRDLLGMRALFRQSRGAAAAALEFVGLPATDSMVELVTGELGTGQCLLRDVADRVGLVQVLPPADPAIRAALDTTPIARDADPTADAASPPDRLGPATTDPPVLR